MEFHPFLHQIFVEGCSLIKLSSFVFEILKYIKHAAGRVLQEILQMLFSNDRYLNSALCQTNELI